MCLCPGIFKNGFCNLKRPPHQIKFACKWYGTIRFLAWHPRNVHPTQQYRLHFVHCDFLKSPDILHPPIHRGGPTVAVTKQPPFFTWIVTKHPLCDIFPTCFMMPLFQSCDTLSLCDILPLFDNRPYSHTVTFNPAASFAPSTETSSPLLSLCCWFT